MKFHTYWSMDFQAFIAGRLGCEKFLGIPKNSKESQEGKLNRKNNLNSLLGIHKNS